MSFENTAEIGDRIKCYDFEPFPGRTDRYVVGTVVAKENFAYAVAVEQDTLFTENVRGKIIAPFATSMDFDNRITKV